MERVLQFRFEMESLLPGHGKVFGILSFEMRSIRDGWLRRSRDRSIDGENEMATNYDMGGADYETWKEAEPNCDLIL